MFLKDFCDVTLFLSGFDNEFSFAFPPSSVGLVSSVSFGFFFFFDPPGRAGLVVLFLLARVDVQFNALVVSVSQRFFRERPASPFWLILRNQM